MSANNLQKEIQHITKMAAANMDHSQIDELISNMLKNGLIYDKPSKKGTSYFITEATHNDHEKAGDNTDVINIGNNNCFARCSNPPSPL